MPTCKIASEVHLKPLSLSLAVRKVKEGSLKKEQGSEQEFKPLQYDASFCYFQLEVDVFRRLLFRVHQHFT